MVRRRCWIYRRHAEDREGTVSRGLVTDNGAHPHRAVSIEFPALGAPRVVGRRRLPACWRSVAAHIEGPADADPVGVQRHDDGREQIAGIRHFLQQ